MSSQKEKSWKSANFLTTCTVMYDFDAEDEEEMTIKEGESIYIFKDVGEWYYCGNKKGKIGYIPANYVERFAENVCRREIAFKNIHSTPLTKPKYSFSSRTALKSICCTKDFMLISDKYDHFYIYDLKHGNSEKPNLMRLSLQRIMLFSSTEEDEKVVEVFIGFYSSNTKNFMIMEVTREDGKVQLRTENIKNSWTYGLHEVRRCFDIVGRNHIAYVVNILNQLQFSECKVDEGKIPETRKIQLKVCFEYVVYHKAQSELIVLTSDLEIIGIQTKNGFPVTHKNEEHEDATQVSFIIDEVSHYILTLEDDFSPKENKRSEDWLNFRIIQEKSIAVASYHIGPLNKLVFVDLHERNIKQKLDIDFLPKCIDVIGRNNYLFITKTNPETRNKYDWCEEDVDKNFLHQVSIFNLVAMKFEDDQNYKNLEVILEYGDPAKDINIDNSYGALVAADYENGESGLRLLIWDVGNNIDDLLLERTDFLLSCDDEEEKTIGIPFIKINLLHTNLYFPRLILHF